MRYLQEDEYKKISPKSDRITTPLMIAGLLAVCQFFLLCIFLIFLHIMYGHFSGWGSYFLPSFAACLASAFFVPMGVEYFGVEVIKFKKNDYIQIEAFESWDQKIFRILEAGKESYLVENLQTKEKTTIPFYRQEKYIAAENKALPQSDPISIKKLLEEDRVLNFMK